jgi:hypothetical protein
MRVRVSVGMLRVGGSPSSGVCTCRGGRIPHGSPGWFRGWPGMKERKREWIATLDPLKRRAGTIVERAKSAFRTEPWMRW